MSNLWRTFIVSIRHPGARHFLKLISSTGVPSRAKLVAAKREIILSAGAYGTPHILLNSGIGDARDLTSVGITPRHELPSVGHNLTDHALTTLTWIVNSTTTYESIRRNETLWAMLLEQWQRNGTGDFSSSGIDHVACLRLPSTAEIFNSVQDPSAGPNTGHFEIIITVGLPYPCWVVYVY